MKPFLSAVFAVVLIGTATWLILEKNTQEYSENVFTTSAVRLPEHH